MGYVDWRKAGLFSAATKRTLWDAVLAFRVDRAEASFIPPPELCTGMRMKSWSGKTEPV